MKPLVVIACVCIFTAYSHADAPHLSAAIPTTVGQTRLRYLTTVDGKPEDWCVVFSNSKKSSETKGPVPVLLFLCGVGDRGSDGDRLFDNGPAAEMQRHDDLNNQLPMMVVSPQCPEDHQWGEAGMDAAVLQLVDLLVADPRVDRDRIYLSGLSMGGKGVWHVAAAGPKYFAAIAAVASMTVAPETVVPAIKDLPIWIIVGGDDGRITRTSHEMADALARANADVVISELPGVGHQSWEMVYPKPGFYDWLLFTGLRGQPPTKKFTSDELLKIASAHIDDPVNDKVVKDFGVFCPYWQIVNCSRKGNPGLRADFNGRKNVMVVQPLTAQTACRMQTTWAIPPEAHAHLKIIAGRGEGDWHISVHADDKEIFAKTIDSTTTQNGWLDNVDLGAWMGKSCHLDVFISQTGEQISPAYFGKLAVEW